MKGPTAVECVVVIAVGLLILTPMIYFSGKYFQGYKEDTNVLSAKTTVEKIGENVDWVYSQGYPSRVQVTVYIPEGIETASLENRNVLLRIGSTSGSKDVFYTTVSDMVGELPTKSGFYKLSIAAINGYVNVSVQ